MLYKIRKYLFIVLLRLRLIASFAFRDILRNRIILIFNAASLSTAFTAIFLTGGILGGFQNSLQNGAINSIGDLMILSASGGENDRIENVDEVASALRNIPDIEAISIQSYSGGSIEYKSITLNPQTVLGIDIMDEQRITTFHDSVVSGRFLRVNDTKNVVLGATLADALVGLEYDEKKIPVGEEIDITFLTGSRGKYRVVGILDAKTFQPNWMIYMNKSEVEKMDATKRDSQIAVKLKPGSPSPEEIKDEIEKKISEVRVMTWREGSGYVDNIIEAVKFVTENVKNMLIAAVFIIVSVTVFVNVFQHRRQIGILKSMGANNAIIISIYLFESFLYFLIAFFVGLMIFFAIYWRSSALPIPLLIGDFSISFDWMIMGVSGIVLLVAALGGACIPAVGAARTRVADVIRETI